MAEAHDSSAFSNPDGLSIGPSGESHLAAPAAAMPAATIRLNSEQSAAVGRAALGYELWGPAGEAICIRRHCIPGHSIPGPKAESPAGCEAIAFTSEQWQQAIQAQGTVEIQGCNGTAIGCLVLNPHVNLFYTVQSIESLLERARESKPGRTLSEILGAALVRAGA
jgi:hypothetical protein